MGLLGSLLVLARAASAIAGFDLHVATHCADACRSAATVDQESAYTPVTLLRVVQRAIDVATQCADFESEGSIARQVSIHVAAHGPDVELLRGDAEQVNPYIAAGGVR